MLVYKDILNLNSEEIEDLENKLIEMVKDRPRMSYNMIQEELPVSDIFIYDTLKAKGLAGYLVRSRKKMDLKKEIVNYVLENPRKYDMMDLLEKFPEAHNNQIINYLKEEDMRELVPTKYYKLAYQILNLLDENPEKYSTQEVIAMLNVNRKTFYRIYNEFPEYKEKYRKISPNAQRIKDFIDSHPDKKFTPQEIGEELELSSIVVNHNLEVLDYGKKVYRKPTMKDKVLEILEDKPNVYTISDIAVKIDASYNSTYQAIKRLGMLEKTIDWND